MNLPETEVLSTTAKIAMLRHNSKRFDRINERTTWGFYGSEIESYISSFSTVLPINLLEFIKRRQNPIIIDLMAPTGTIRNLCERTNIIPKIAIAVSLQDQRTESEKNADASFNIHQFTGNLLDFETWRNLSDMLAGQKANLIMERAKLGLQFVPNGKIFYNLALHGLWNILDENGGLLLMQTHNHDVLQKNGVNLTKWRSKVEKCDVIVELDADKRTLMLQKYPTSPTDLPEF